MSSVRTPKNLKIFKTLSHPVRVGILNLLDSEVLSVTDLSKRLKKRQSNISQHLQILRENNLVSQHKRGKKRIYKLSGQGIFICKCLEKLIV